MNTPGTPAGAAESTDVVRARQAIPYKICMLIALTRQSRILVEPMTPREIIQFVDQHFPGKITASFADDRHPRVHVDAENWRAIAEFLIKNPQLKLDWLANHTGVDYVADNKMCVVHDLWSFDLRQ